MLLQCTTNKTYTKILDSMLSEMAEIYIDGKASGQSEIALTEQIRTAYMTVFKMDLLTATECTRRVIDKCSPKKKMFSVTIDLPRSMKISRVRAIQNALSY